jgi:hypothetical protein
VPDRSITTTGPLAATVPLALALLVREGTLRYWRVLACPHCGRRHHHGGWAGDADPRQFLGPRLAHCGTGARRGYWLVDAGEAPTRARLRTRRKVTR